MPKLCLYFPPTFPDPFWAGEHFCFEAPEDANRGEWLIGRHPQADLTLAPLEVSRRHCVVRYSYAANRWSVEDLGSTGGTWLNDQRLSPGDPAPIQIGDHLLLGNCWLNIVEDEQDTLNAEGPTTIVGTSPIDHRTGMALAPPPPAPPAPPPAPLPPKTLGDTLYLGASWIITPTTMTGMVYRLIVLAVAAAVVVLIMGGAL